MPGRTQSPCAAGQSNTAAELASDRGPSQAAVAASKGNEETPQPEGGARQPQEVTVVEQPPPDVVRDDALTQESDPAGYTAPSSTEGVEHGVRDSGDDPMIGGGSRT